MNDFWDNVLKCVYATPVIYLSFLTQLYSERVLASSPDTHDF